MKLVSYSVTGKIRLGALRDDDFIVDLNRAHRELLSSHPDSAKGRRISRLLPPAMLPFLQAGKGAMESAQETLRFVERQSVNGGKEALLRKRILVLTSTATLAAPVPRPPKLIAVWVNYEEHAQEVADGSSQDRPALFHQISHSRHWSRATDRFAQDQPQG